MNKKIISYYKQNLSLMVIFLFLLMIIGSFFEIIGIGLFIPLLSGGNETGFNDFINSFFAIVSLEYTHINIAIVIIIIFLVKFIIMNIQNFYIYKISNEFLYKTKKTIINNLYFMNFIEYNKIGVHTLNNIFTKEIEKSALSIQYFLQVIVNIIYTAAYFIFAIYINYIIVLIAILIGGIVIMIQKKITKSIIVYSKTVVDGNTKTNLIVLQILNSMKYIKSTNRYEYSDNVFDTISRNYSHDVQKMSFLNSIPKYTPEFVGVLVISFIIIINELTLKEDIVTVVFLGLLLYRTLTKLLSIQSSYQSFIINIGAIEKIIDIQNYISKHEEKVINNSADYIESIKNIDLKHISMKIYDKEILNDISLELRKGNIYSLVGQSGAGKSTLLNILTLLYSPTNGYITINNKKDINIKSFKEKVGYVSQETVIFDGSIKENILFGENLDEDKYQNIVTSIGINNINVDRLTMNGTNISGGQRQLISLARELYREADFLILDEFTSALDSATEKKVMQFINSIKKEKIIIIVAHRLSSIINSNIVFLMKNGKIIDSASFNHLYNKNSDFKTMCNNQNIFLEGK